MVSEDGEDGSVGVLDGKTALITGASKGIGRAIAIAMSAAGASVAVTSRSLSSVENLKRECGESTLPIALDIGDEGSCNRAVQSVLQEFGHLDVLVNNAGVAESAKFLDTDTAMWHRILTVDLDGPFWMTRAALPNMLERSSGRIISIGSVASRIGLAYAAPYTAAKHGLLGLTRTLANEFPRSGVTFNCVCPHYVDTPMTDETITRISSKTRRSTEDSRQTLLTPQGTLVDSRDVAELCVFLASPAAGSVTGQAIQIDGGKVQA
jgi:NAD(P)-dependent dehydrogenase (short-subunit alcohol dehydrogenase family)